MTAEVFRDPWGIPHLRADSVDELAHLQGRNAATDRAWQLEWNRHRAEGRTAELIGAPGLVWDRFARAAVIDATAQRCYQGLDERSRRWCERFVDGVNAGLAGGASGAHEFTVLDITPGRWQPWTPLAVFWVQQLLFGGFPYKLWRRHVADRIGPEAPGWLDAGAVDSPGSNAWAIGGERTASGLPIIAGDPHRTADFPGVYQQVRLACAEFDVFGFSFPGVPGIQHFGHAGSVAWAITNASADYQDLYLEELSRTANGWVARGPAGPEPVQHRQEMIMVRDGDPEPVQIKITERGPVIIDEPAGPTISLRTPSAVDGDLGFGALLPLLHSRSVADVEAALGRWVEPVNSAVVADRHGRIRHLVPGRVPRRDPANLEVPVPAWEDRFGWQSGYVPMPVDPVDDLVANANDRGSGGGLGRYYSANWRVDRIRTLLDRIAPGTADVAAMPTIHRDVWSGPAARAQRLLAEITVDGAEKLIKDQILAWDARMDADSRPALLYAAWRAAMVDWLLTQDVFAGLADPEPLPAVYAATMAVRTRVGYAFDAICRNADRFGLDLATGIITALRQVAADPPTGVWGEEHRLAPLHGLTGLADDHVPPMPRPALAGDANTVRSTHSTPGVTHRCSMASMARYVWDLADPSASRWVVPFGASGRPDSPHYVDQNDAWVVGDLQPVIIDWEKLIKETDRVRTP
ncbi:penicillin acylase family protein [Microlunatus soli]|uniref:Penicillin amidase n=1 Tax=Microlunatus soli TaxID=630515 RepID=A0A1H1QCQ4_9ACTN|nr:penicillin acylase family protein [Microlunatus soli]SDS21210.1 penicillin amidase [Microlunatus soli]